MEFKRFVYSIVNMHFIVSVFGRSNTPAPTSNKNWALNSFNSELSLHFFYWSKGGPELS